MQGLLLAPQPLLRMYLVEQNIKNSTMSIYTSMTYLFHNQSVVRENPVT